MADYFTQTSFAVECKDMSHRATFLQILEKHDLYMEDKDEPSGFKWTRVFEEGSWAIGFEDDGGHLDTEKLVRVLQAYLTEVGQLKPIEFSWAETCNKPRYGAFGGGAARVYKNRTEWFTTEDFLQGNLGGVDL